ncbi:alpha/beta hydrolase [Gordonia sp. HY285]|uniref:alpha/beta hydrolase n=1 Tax=Gordonia liuliyuniae TaxID=2911517 RepID=UPI001F4490BC|nr:alpha/beta hydrolase [Gordonia liuliyuniae]MCF8610470.1 alpha/beta hydrolase [Gordonia liuliyuniae]
MVETRTAQRVPTTASTRSRLAAVATRYGVGTFTGHLRTDAAGVRLSRRTIAALMRAFGSTPSGTTVEKIDERTRPDGPVRGEWVYGPGADRASRRVIYFLHGSAYMMCSPSTHRSFAARLSAITALPVFVLDYRLAPEFRFPAAADDVDAGWDWLVGRGYDPSDIVVAGDSAGGHLASTFILNRAAAQQTLPAGVVLFSPVIDLTFGLAAQRERVRRDPMITAANARGLVELYTVGADMSDRRLTLDYAAAADCPPVLVQAGGAEMLQADARHFASCFAAQGGEVTTEIWPGQMHVFQALPRLGPEPDAALLRVRDFITDALDSRRTVQGATS